MSRVIDYIIIHEADCPLHKPDGTEFTIKDIDEWHLERGFRRTPQWRRDFNPDIKACGYHYVIGITGALWTGRHVDEIPAAVQGHNHDSMNICLIGKGKYTLAQWSVLKLLASQLKSRYNNAEIKGHREFDTAIAQGKTCPDFDVQVWVKNNMKPLDDHISN
jgi:hypothetical protein